MPEVEGNGGEVEREAQPIEPARSPLVTVVVPTFNRIRYLKEALESAIAQTYRAIEIIVSDDGGAEDVREEVLPSLGDSRILYRRNPATLGMGLNIWTAFREAKGKYVATLHDDDLWEPGFLAALVPPLEDDPSISVAFSDHTVVDENGSENVALADRNTRLWRRDVLPTGRVENLLEAAVVDRAVPAAMAAVFRRSAIDWDDFPDEIGTFYDAWLPYLAARTGAAGYYDRRRLTRYRVHGASETRSWTQLSGRLRALRQSEFMYRRYLSDAALASIRPFSEREYRRSVLSLAMALFEAGRPDEARQILQRATGLIRSRACDLMLQACRLPGGVLKQASGLGRRLSLLVSRPA